MSQESKTCRILPAPVLYKEKQALSIASYFLPPLHCCCMIGLSCCSEHECHVSNYFIFSPEGKIRVRTQCLWAPENTWKLQSHVILFFLIEIGGQSSQGWLLSNLFVRIRKALPSSKSFYFIMQEVTYFREDAK